MGTFERVYTKIIELIITVVTSVIGSLFFVSPAIVLVCWLIGVKVTSELFLGSVVFGALCLAVYFQLKDYKENNPICSHGIRTVKNLCPMCNEIADEKRQEKVRLAEIARKEEGKRKTEEANRMAEEEKRKAEEEWRRRILLQQEVYLRNQLNWREFEDAIAELFRQLGYKVQQTPYSNDYGRDAIMFKDGKKYLLECKQYGVDKSIGRPQLQKFYGAMVEDKAVKGFFVNTGLFASTTYEYALPKSIELIGMARLLDLMKQVYGDSGLGEGNKQVNSSSDREQIQFQYQKLDEEENPVISPHGIKDEKHHMPCDTSSIVAKNERIEELKKRRDEENKRRENVRIVEAEHQKQEKLKMELEQKRRNELEIEDILRNQLNHMEFKNMVIKLFAHRGYKVQQTPHSDNNGKYIIMFKSHCKYLLQYNQYGVQKTINIPQLQNFNDVIQKEKAVRGFYVNTGSFTLTAYDYVKTNNIELIDMSMLVELMN